MLGINGVFLEKLLQQTPPKVKQDDFQDVKQRSTPKTPKTPPKIEIEKSSSPKVRQQAVRDEPDRYKAKPAQEIVEQDRHDGIFPSIPAHQFVLLKFLFETSL